VLGRIQPERERVKLSIDVMVMTFAAVFGGGIVYTSDLDDFARLQPFFPSVRILAV
jgi:hypothetical protein